MSSPRRCVSIAWLYPNRILQEYTEVASRQTHAPYREGFFAMIAELERVAFYVQPADMVFGLRDPDDEVYLQTATTANAVLVTGNRRHFTEPRYGSVTAFSPRAFLEQASQR